MAIPIDKKQEQTDQVEEKTTLQLIQSKQAILKEEEKNVCVNPFEMLYDQARAFMADHKFHYDDDFRETVGNNPIKFVGRKEHKGKAGKAHQTEWLFVQFLDFERDCSGIRITFGSHHPTLQNLGRITKIFKISEEKYSGLTEEERLRFEAQKRINREQAEQKEKLEKQIADQQADYALEKFSKASTINPPPDAITYFSKKGLNPCDLIRWEKEASYTEDSKPVIEWIAFCALQNFNGKIRAIQELYPKKRKFAEGKERNKNFVGKTSGCFFLLGKLENGRRILLCEGIATAMRIFFSTGETCLAVLSSGSYDTIAKEVKKRFPDSEITICADNDAHKGEDKNTGLKMAKAVAIKYKYRLAIPEFPEEYRLNAEGQPNKDFDDMGQVQAMGKEEIKRQIEIATIPTEKIESAPPNVLNQVDQEEDREEAGDALKAKATARRKAIAGSAQEEIIQSILNQYPTLRDQAEDIASKAFLWGKKHSVGECVIVNGIPKKITDMNSLDKLYAQLEVPYQPCVIINLSDAQTISSKDLNQRLSGEVVVSGIDAKGQPKYTGASAFWTGNCNKKVFKKMVFTSQPIGDDTYNLFNGFGVDPKKGDCNKILTHIKEVICANNEKNYEALIKLLAWQLRNIGKPSRVIVILKSIAQQIGKGALLQDILLKIYGNAGFMTSDMGQIVTRFNDTLRGKAYVYLDEALFAGDLKGADSVKSLATATQLSIETKHLPVVKCPFGTNFFLSTNHPNAAFIEEADARYWVLEVSPHRYGNTQYFKELFDEIEGRGVAAFMEYLLNLDIENFIPWRDVPKDNEFKDEMIRNSINPYDARKWIEDCCNARMIIGLKPLDKNSQFPWEPWQKGDEYENGLFQIAYAEWQKTVKSPVAAKTTKVNKFGELLNKAGFVLRVDGQRLRKLPDPDECLKTLTGMIEKVGK